MKNSIRITFQRSFNLFEKQEKITFYQTKTEQRLLAIPKGNSCNFWIIDDRVNIDIF